MIEKMMEDFSKAYVNQYSSAVFQCSASFYRGTSGKTTGRRPI